VLPDARLSSKQKTPRGKETRPSSLFYGKGGTKFPNTVNETLASKTFRPANIPALWQSQRIEMRCWEIIADKLSASGLSWGYSVETDATTGSRMHTAAGRHRWHRVSQQILIDWTYFFKAAGSLDDVRARYRRTCWLILAALRIGSLSAIQLCLATARSKIKLAKAT